MLEKARAVNLDRASHLPNFMADEEVNCYVQPADRPIDKPALLRTATIRSEVTFKGMNETRQQVDARGKPVPSQGVPAGCIGWSGGFGAYLRPVFDPKCGTTITFSKTIGEPGKQSLVYNFSTPAEGGCFPPSLAGFERFYAGREGSVLIDIPSGIMISVVGRSRGFPKAFEIEGIQETVIWGVVKIEGQAHLLPVSYEKVMSIWNGGTQRVFATYTNHRQFEASSTITFQ